MSVAADAAYLSVPTIRGEVEAETGQHAGAAGRREDLQVCWWRRCRVCVPYVCVWGGD